MAEHYTFEEITKNAFLFVSYQHNNKDIVTNVIDSLLDSGVRLWYDVDLDIGDKWNDIAEKLIKHPNCKGVIFFNSTDSFKSEPVYQERCFALEKANENRKKSLNFPIFPVNIGKPSTIRLLKSIFEELPDDDKVMEKLFPLEFLKNISEIFTANTIYCYAAPDDTEGYISRLYESIVKAAPEVIDNGTLAIKKLSKNNSQQTLSIEMGICKNKLASGLPEYLLKNDGTVLYKNNQYIIQNNTAYSVKNITWRPLYCENDIFVFLSENIVDVRNGGKELEQWLNGNFLTESFTDKEKQYIQKIRLLNAKDLSQIADTEKLIFPPEAGTSESNWWINEMGMGVLQKVIKKNGTTYNSGYNYRIKKCGVRPIICVHKDSIEELTEQ